MENKGLSQLICEDNVTSQVGSLLPCQRSSAKTLKDQGLRRNLAIMNLSKGATVPENLPREHNTLHIDRYPSALYII